MARLALSEHTIRNYLLRIYDKLGISNRVDLVLYAVRTDSSPMANDSSRIVRSLQTAW